MWGKFWSLKSNALKQNFAKPYKNKASWRFKTVSFWVWQWLHVQIAAQRLISLKESKKLSPNIWVLIKIIKPLLNKKKMISKMQECLQNDLKEALVEAIAKAYLIFLQPLLYSIIVSLWWTLIHLPYQRWQKKTSDRDWAAWKE